MLDVFLSITGLLILSPIFLVLMILIKLDSEGPIFFKQKRVGKNKGLFNILKFRTMIISTPKDIPTHLLENSKCCITRVGRILRKTSLDELPQLLNILFGDMSFIGPRPALWNQFDLVEARDKYKANNVTPGLTGWAQINGRDKLSIDEKAKLDGEYVTNFGFVMDCKCFFKSFISVVKHDEVIEGKSKSIIDKK
ncbi:sugar transferase [Bacillus massiliigorillae]|uniref:sugar transferase n=1 Tax=Bacillus massiliigorillae TaxID=1243664 RepID=UPI0009DCCD36|nr:sugar transferase [Bacillus massiliigorillae]